MFIYFNTIFSLMGGGNKTLKLNAQQVEEAVIG